MDWLECEEIEAVPGKMGGRPVVKGTRLEPELILTEEEYGRTPEETHADFPTLSVDVVVKARVRPQASARAVKALKVLLVYTGGEMGAQRGGVSSH